MIKLFLSVMVATVFMGFVACEPTSTTSTSATAVQTPTPATASTDAVKETVEATETPTSSIPVKAIAAQSPPATMESSDTVTEMNEPGDTPVVSTESTGNVTGDSSGTVMEYSPGEILTLKTETGEALRCKFGEIVTYVTSDGKVIDASKIRRDSKVRVLYHKDGDDTIVDKVIVTGVRD